MSFYLAVCSLLALAVLPSCSKPVAPRIPPAPVDVAQVIAADVPREIRTMGTVDPIEAVEVRAQVSGILSGISFHEGDDVKAGQQLFQIDARTLEAVKNQANSQLDSLRVQLANAKLQFERGEALVKDKFLSQADFDQLRANYDNLKATVKAQEAAFAKANLDRAFTSITAPISGRAGQLQVKRGDLISAQSTLLVTINQLHPIEVKFSIPEKNLPAIQEAMRRGPVAVRAMISKESAEAAPGTVVFVDNAVDSKTGSILLKARFDNEDEKLWPGRFVDLVIVLETLRGMPTVPAAALQTGQQGDFVYVVNAEKKAEIRKVVTGPSLDGLLVIMEGLQLGETVVTDGQNRLLPGATVEIRTAPEKKQEKAQ